MSLRSHQCADEVRPGTVAGCDRPQNHGRPIRTQRVPSAIGRNSINPTMEKFWATGDPEVFQQRPAERPDPFAEYKEAAAHE